MFSRSLFSLLLLAFLVFVPSNGAWASTDKASRLLELARLEFGNPNKAERRLFEAVANGTVADYSAKEKEHNDLASADRWGDHRVIKGSRIIWVCTDPQASLLVTHRGISIKGARIDEELNLRFAKISFPLVIENCSILGGIDVEHAQFQELDFSGSHTGPIRAEGVKIEGNLCLQDGMMARGEVFLCRAKIGGNLQIRNAHLINRGGKALSADQITVARSVYLNKGFRAEGEVRLPEARIEGSLDCLGGQFLNDGGYALAADGAEVGGSVSLKRARAEGEVRFVNAAIGRHFKCHSGLFINKRGKSLNLAGLKVGGIVFLRDSFKSEGMVDLTEASISGRIICTGGQFINKEAQAVNANWIEVGSSVFLNKNFRAEGEVRFLGAMIDGALECSNGQFHNIAGETLVLDAAQVQGNISLKGMKSEGEVSLHGASIGGDLICQKGLFLNKGAIAVDAGMIKVTQHVFLKDGLRAEGEVNLHSATVGGNLECGGNSEFMNKGGQALTAENIKVGGNFFVAKGFRAEGEVTLCSAKIDKSFVWHDVVSPDQIALDLRSARIGTLEDDFASWPGAGKVCLQGFVYDEISAQSPVSAQRRIDWLHRQPDKPFGPQPYEQLAAVLRKRGSDEDAKEILIQKNKDRAQFTQLTFSEWWWFRVLGPMIGYGYRPWRALWIGLLIALSGSVLFKIAYRKDIMTPIGVNPDAFARRCEDSRSSVYQVKFNSLIYSLDTFVPLIDLHVARYWLPNANRGSKLPKIGGMQVRIGGLIRVWQCFQIVAGWILTTLLVLGLTGMVRS